MAASPVALEKALALPATGAYTITPKLVGGGPATVTATTVSPATTSNTSNTKTVTVSTTTTSGSTAFNAFTDFTVGKGVSVNLVIPTGTKNLVNTVDNPVVINGTIYSTLNIGNGSVIAGHVFFLAPNGFLLGPDGSINVGALTVATAKASLANANAQSSSYGQLDLADFPTSAVLSGTVPLDGTGTIDIQGKIDASGVNDSTSGDGSVSLLSANAVTVEAGAQVNAGGSAPLAAFTAVVNASGGTVNSATGVTTAPGGDVILTGGTMDVAGQVVADGLGSGAAGNVTANATGLTVDSGGSITARGDASGSGAGGVVGLTSTGDASISGALKADASSSGSAGSVSVTGATVEFAGSATATGGSGTGNSGGVTLTSTSGAIDVTGTLTGSSTGSVKATSASDLTLEASSAITEGYDLTFSATGLVDAKNAEAVGRDYSVTGQSFYDNTLHPTFGSNGRDFIVDWTNTLAFSPGSISTAPRNLLITATAGAMTIGSVLNAGGAIDLTAMGNLTVTPVLNEGTDIALSSGAALDVVAQQTALRDYSVTFNTESGQTLNPNLTSGRDFNIDDTNTARFTVGTLPTAPRNLSVTTAGDFTLTGGTLTAHGGETFTIAGAMDVSGTGKIDTGAVGAGNAGPVTITSTGFTLEQGGVITAAATTGTEGAIGVTVATSQTVQLGDATATGDVTIDGAITGASVTITDTANAKASLSVIPTQLLDEGSTRGVLAGLLLGLTGAYVNGQGTTDVEFQSAANVHATGGITVSATSTSEGSAPLLNLIGASPTTVSVSYAEIESNATVHVASGAHLSAGAALSLLAQNNGTLSAVALSYQDNTAGASVSSMADAISIGVAGVHSNMNVDAGALLSAQSITAVANNQDNLGVTATSYATGGATAGIAFAYKDTTTTATTNFAASTGAAAVTTTPTAPKTGPSLSLQAIDDTITDSTSASTSTGPTISGRILDATVGRVQNASKSVWGKFLSTSPGTAANSELESADSGGDDGSGHYRIAATVAITESDGSANVILGAGATTPSSNYSTGDVVVAALESDLSVRDNAQAEVASSESDSTTNAFSAAVAYADYNHSSLAEIAPATTVDANRIAVDAQTLQPISNDFLQVISDPSVSTVLAHLNPNAGVVNTIITSYANAIAQGTSLALAGALNLFNSTTDSYSWIGDGAHLTTAAGAGTAWSATLADGTVFGGTGPTQVPGGVAYVSAPAWSDGLVVDAYTEQSSIDVGGGFGIAGLVLSPPSNISNSTSVGGAYNGVTTDATTIAGIDAGASVTAPTGLGVNALTDNQIVALAPSSGSGSGIGGSGMVSNLLVTNHTHAIVSNDASISTDALSMEAQQTFELINVAADYVSAGKAAIGAGAAASTMNTDTTAQIGDATGDAATVYGVSSVTSPTATGTFDIDSVTIHADTDGYAAQAGIAGAAANGPPPAAPSTESSDEENADVVESGGFAAFWANVEKDSSDSGSTPSFGLAGAGSVALSFANADSTAQIQGLSASKKVAISAYTSGGAVTTNVVARDNPTLVAGAGAGAKIAATNDSPNTVAIAGAVTVQEPNDHAIADITDATITGAGSTNVESLVGGVAVSAALAASVNSGATTTGSKAFAGAVSVFIDTDEAHATVDTSTLTGLTGGSGRNTTVTAYDDTDIGVGGGAGFSAGQAGAGFAASYIGIGDPTGATAVEAEITNSTVSQMDSSAIQAGDASVLVGLAAVGATGGGTANELTGSVVDIELTRSVLAEANASSVTAGSISVTANGLRQGALDNVLIDNGSDTSGTTGYDFTGQTSTTGAVEDGSGDSLAVGSGKGALIVAAAGQVATGGKNVVGASYTGVDLAGSHKAIVDNSTLNAGTGAVNVKASDDALVVGLGVGVASGTNFTVTGSLTLMHEGSTILSDVNTASQVTGGQITLQATDAVTMASLAGDFAKSTTGAAGDAAVAIMTADGTASATAESSTLAASTNLAVSAADTGLLVDIAVAGAKSTSSLAIEGAIVTNVVDQGAVASLTSVTDSAGGSVNVGAGSSQTIWAGALAAGYSSNSVAAGVGVITNVLGDNSNGERARALIDGGSYTVSDITVGSSADATLNVAGVGIQVGNASATGSVVTNVNRGDVIATIDDGANVVAQDNVGVEASSADTANVIAGAVAIGKQAAGIGVSVVTNVFDGGTNASIGGSTTQVTALASNSGDTLTVDTGGLASPVNLSDINSLTSPVATGLTLATKTVTGVAVNAASTEQIDVAALSLGLSKQIGVAANIVTNVTGGTTSAIVDQASIDQGAGTAGSGQTVDVSASDNAYTADLVGSIAGGQTVGFAAAVNTAGFDRTTDAHITGGTVGAENTANVLATSSQTTVGLTIGGAAGKVGLAASATIATFDATTRSYASGGSITAGTLNVNATDDVGDNINTGAVAIGQVAVGGGFDVTQNDNTTFAGIGRSSVPTVSDPTFSAATIDAGTTQVIADTEATWHLHTLGGSGGANAAIAAMGGILLTADDTEAGVYGGTVQASGSGGSRVSASTLTVKATDNVTGEMITGALALSGSVGVGASIGVILDSDSVGSTIDGANVEAGNINVNTFTTRNLGEILVTGAGGVDAGIGATVGVIMIGGGEAGGYGEQAFDELLPTLSNIGTSASAVAAGSGNTTLTGGEQTLANNASGVTTPGSLSDVTFSSVLAEVKNSTLTGSNVQVTDTVSTVTSQQDGALGVGLYFGAGGSVGYTAFSDHITASIDPDSTVTAGTISVTALTQDDGDHAGEVNSYVGSAGLVGIGAAVAVVDDDMVVDAQAGGALTGTGASFDLLSVAANDTTTDKTTTYDGSLGGGAAGAVVSEITKDGSVEGQILATPSGTATTITKFGSVSVAAASSGSLNANGLAASGGAGFALSGAYVSAEDGDSVDAQLGVSTFGATPGGIIVSASRVPQASATATGISLGGGLAVGASISQATVDGHDIAQVASGSSFADGASLTVKAFMTQGGGDSTSATSVAGAGSLFVGADASTATASNSSSVEAYVNSNVAFGTGNLTIQADRDVDDETSATGIAVGGLLAVGATIAQTSDSGDVSAWLDKGFKSVDNGPAVLIGALKIEAGTGIGTTNPATTGGDTAGAIAISGSGAPIAGTAGVATTSQTATIYAGIKDFDAPPTNGTLSTIYAMDGVTVDTNYITQSNVSADTLQAALAGGSGAVTTRTVSPTLTTYVGAELALETPASLSVTSLLQSVLGGETQTGAGGLINGNAAVDTATVDPTITLTVGANDKLLVLGDPSNGPGALKLIAGALVTGTDTGSMTTGGGIEGPYVKTDISATFNTTITVGSGVSLLGVGAIDIGDYAISTVTTDVEVSTYGGVGAAGGESVAQVNANNTINIGSNTNIAAYGDITIAAGQSADGFESTVLNTTATSNVYNYTALPVNTDEYARAEADNTSNLNIAAGVDIEGVANVNLIAYDPAENVTASGKGHNPYLSIFGVTSDDSHPVSSSNSTITFAGKANAGVLANEGVSIAQDGTVTLLGSLFTIPNGLVALGQAALNGGAATSSMLDTYDSLQAQINAETVIEQASPINSTAYDTASAAIAALTALQNNAPYTTVSVGGTTSTPPSAAVIQAYQTEYTYVVGLLTATQNSTTATAAQISTATADLNTLSGLPLAIAQQQAIIYDPGSTSAQVSAAMAEIAALDSALPGNGSTSAPVKVGVPVPAVTIAPLYAAAGNLTIQAKTFTDTNTAANTLTAQGGVAITISDARTGVPSGADLVTDVITVPVENATGGNVYFLGGAVAPGNASVVHQINPNGTPAVTIQNTSSNASGSPLILADGEIDNYGGSVSISNLEGDIGQYAEINSLSLSILAPQGVYAVPNLDGTAKAGATPESLWAGDQIINSNTSGSDLAYYEANAEFNNGAFPNVFYTGLFNAYLTSDYYGSNQQSPTGATGAAHQLGYSTTCTGASCVNVLVLYTNVPVPGNGSQNFDGSDFGFDQVPIYTTYSSKTAAQAPTDYSKAISSSAVFINATNINVNNTIHAGASNWSVDITDTTALDAEIALLNSQFSKGLIGGGDVDVTSLVTTANSGDRQISVNYDVADQRFVLGGIKGGAAGLVELTGGIANTSPTAGLIQVNNGLAAINVSNDTTIPLEVDTLNAGSSSPAMVVITDTNKKLNNAPITTWFVQPVGQASAEYDDKNEILAGQAASLTGAENITPTNGVLSYTPESNLRFYWTDTYTAARTINAPGSYVYNWSANAWNATGGGETSNYFQVDTTGDTNFFDTKLSGSITNEFWNSFGISCGCRGFPNNPFTVNALDVTGVSVTETSSLKADNLINVSFGGNTSGTINIASEGSVLIAGTVSNPYGATNITVADGSTLQGSIQEAGGSIVAQNLALAAGSIGYSPSASGVNSPAPLNLTLTSGSSLTARSNTGVDLAITGTANLATISATNGDVIISATQGIYETSGAPAIVGDNITLAGGSGGVGAAGAPITIAATQFSTDPSVTQHGVVNASGILDIDIEKTSGDLLLGQVVSTNGNVVLKADTGSIANAITAFTVDSANATALSNEWTALNLQNVAAAIAQTITPFQNGVNADYREYWGIVQDATIAAGKATLTPSATVLFAGSAFAASGTLTTADHNLLSQIVANSTISLVGGTPQVALTPVQEEVFSSEVKTALNLSTTPTSTQIDTYIQNQYATYYAATTSYVYSEYSRIKTYVDDTTTFDAGPPAGFFTAYDPNYAYTLTATSDPALYAALTKGAGAWTNTQLADSINANALVPVSNTTIVQQAPNASGKAITLTAASGQIGNNLALDIVAADGVVSTDGSTLTVNITNPATLTDTDRALLAAAAPGDLTVNGPTSNPTSITIALPHLVGLDATGAITATASGNIYLGSNEAGALADVASDNGQVRLRFAGSITNAAANCLSTASSCVPAVKAGFLIIESSNGDVGTAAKPLTISLFNNTGAATPILDSARASGNLYISEVLNSQALSHTEADNLNLGVIFAGSALVLNAQDGAITAYDPSIGITYAPGVVRIQGGSIALAAENAIGTSTAPLQVQTSGLLTANGAALYLYSPTASLALGASTIQGYSQLTGDGFAFDGAFNDVGGLSVSSTGAVVVAAAGSIIGDHGGDSIVAPTITVGAGAAIEQTNATTAGAVALQTTSGALTFGANTLVEGGSLALTSAGAMTTGASDAFIALIAPVPATTTDAAFTAATSVTFGDNDSVQANTSIGASGQTVVLGAGDSFAAGSTITLAGSQGVSGGTGDLLNAVSGITASSAAVAFGANLKATTAGGLIAFTSTVGTLALGQSDALTAPTVSLTAKALLNVGSGDILTAKSTDVSLTGAVVLFGSQDSLTATRNISVASLGTLTGGSVIGLTANNGAVSVTASDMSFGQSVTVQTPLAIAFTATSGGVAFGGAETLHGQSVALTGRTAASLGAGALITTTAGVLKVTGSTLTLGSNDVLRASGELDLVGTGTVTGSGTETLSSTSGELDVTGQSIVFQGPLYATSYGPMTLTALSGAVQIAAGSTIDAYNTLTFAAPGGLTVGASTIITVGSTFSWTDYQAATFGANDRITVGGAVTGRSDLLTFASGDSLTANGAINLTTTGGGMVLAALTSNQGGGAAITLTSATTIWGDGDGQTNLTTAGSAGVVMTAGGDIGSSGLALSMKTNSLTATGRGTMWLKTIGNLLTRKTTAPGAIMLNGQKVASN